jgi:hypothetical protein
MNFARANSASSSRCELAAVRLLLCAQAAGAHHQTTPMTRTPVASAQGNCSRVERIRFAFHAQPGDELASIYYVIAFFVALTAFLAAALTFANHPVPAVLLALGAMALLLHSLAELLQVSRVRFEPSWWEQGENDSKHY